MGQCTSNITQKAWKEDEKGWVVNPMYIRVISLFLHLTKADNLK